MPSGLNHIVDSYFVNNNAVGRGGCIATAVTTELTVINSMFEDNSAYSGSAIYNSNKATLTNVTATGNRAETSGGVLFTGKGSTVTVTRSNFTCKRLMIMHAQSYHHTM